MATGGLQVKGLSVVSAKDMRCNCCGVCCQTYSKVDVNVSDIFLIAEHLGMAPGDFFTKYCKVASDGADSAIFLLDIEGGCKFQRDDKCIIYPVRPDMCAGYPFNIMCLNASRWVKREANIRRFQTCFVHALPDDLIIVPDLERMVDSRILFMVKEMYLAKCGGTFDEAEALEYHKRGQAQVKNPRMRNIMHLQLLNEFLKDPPRDVDTKEPLLTPDEIRMIYNYARGLARP
jgi:hypothetical protein